MHEKDWVNKLIKEYETGLSDLNKQKNKLNAENLVDEKDIKLINSMISDMIYSINWLKIGREPDARRGIDRQSIYQRTVLLDPDIFPSLDIIAEDKPICEDKKRAMINILWELSERERQCFILNKAYGMSYNKIAKELKISKSSVQVFIKRATDKIEVLSYDCNTVANYL